MTVALVRPGAAIAFELRGAWATGRRIAVSLHGCQLDRVEGHVQHVAASGAHARIADRHIPLAAVLAVHLPSRLGDSTARSATAWHGRPRRPADEPLKLWEGSP